MLLCVDHEPNTQHKADLKQELWLYRLLVPSWSSSHFRLLPASSYSIFAYLVIAKPKFSTYKGCGSTITHITNSRFGKVQGLTPTEN